MSNNDTPEVSSKSEMQSDKKSVKSGLDKAREESRSRSRKTNIASDAKRTFTYIILNLLPALISVPLCALGALATSALSPLGRTYPLAGAYFLAGEILYFIMFSAYIATRATE